MTDNPKALKHLINKDLLVRIGHSIHRVYPEFDNKAFIKLEKRLSFLELKPRVQLLREGLREHLPKSYTKAVKVILASLKADQEDLKGFDLWPYTEFIQSYGLDHLQLSLTAMKSLTTKFTSEFAVRPYLEKYTDETLEYLLEQATSPEVSVRRWASEGTRPRLPWGQRLPKFIANPFLTLPILETLKLDPELFVRKSVANHLNDISKDHPDFVIQVLKRWKDQVQAESEHHAENKLKIEWIIKHSLRGLIKAGDGKALALIGVTVKAKFLIEQFILREQKLKMGEKLNFSFQRKSLNPRAHKVVVDYRIHFQKASGKTSAKVFKFKTFDLKSRGEILLSKSHHLKEVTTRSHYPGLHLIEILVNGHVVKQANWHLD
jgi:3-methyladenine DNA glycosylase AlkC